jgi:acyl-CoA dehydrogenase
VEGDEEMTPRVFRPSPWDDPAPFYLDEHRHLARKLANHEALERDEALQEPLLVGRRLAELGLFAHLGKPRELCVVREILAYHSPLADAVFAVQGLCAQPLAMAGRQEDVAALVRGDRIGGFALTEPEAGSDVASMRTRARKEGNEWVLDGEKTLISNVGIAHQFVVFAKAAGETKKTISAFLVPADAQGVELVSIPLSGDHPLGRIVLSSCRLPESALVGSVGQGLALALGTLGTYRASVGAAANGMAWRALEETLAHVQKREQFGKKLAELQLVQAAIAEMSTDLCAARLLVANAAYELEADRTMTEEGRRNEQGRIVSMAKMHATETAQRIIDRAVQLHGGMGVALGTKVEELYREIRPLRIYEGATDVLKLVVAQSVLKRS